MDTFDPSIPTAGGLCIIPPGSLEQSQRQELVLCYCDPRVTFVRRRRAEVDFTPSMCQRTEQHDLCRKVGGRLASENSTVTPLQIDAEPRQTVIFGGIFFKGLPLFGFHINVSLQGS